MRVAMTKTLFSATFDPVWGSVITKESLSASNAARALGWGAGSSGSIWSCKAIDGVQSKDAGQQVAGIIRAQDDQH